MSLVKESQRVNANLLFNKSLFAPVQGVMKVLREFFLIVIWQENLDSEKTFDTNQNKLLNFI